MANRRLPARSLPSPFGSSVVLVELGAGSVSATGSSSSGSVASLLGASLEGASVVCPGLLLFKRGFTLLTCTGALALAALAVLALGWIFNRFLRRRPRGLLSTVVAAGASSFSLAASTWVSSSSPVTW